MGKEPREGLGESSNPHRHRDTRSVHPGQDSKRPELDAKKAPAVTADEREKAMKYVAENLDVFEAVVERLKGKRPEIEYMEDDSIPLHAKEKTQQQSSHGPQGFMADARRGSVVAPTVESVPLPRQRLGIRSRSFKSVRQEADPRMPRSRPEVPKPEYMRVIQESPFSWDIAEYLAPDNFKVPKMDTYDGTSDPTDHLFQFQTAMSLKNILDPLRCKTFPMYLRGKARRWFQELPPQSVDSFRQLAQKFKSQFVSSAPFIKNSSHLMTLKQGPEESVLKYMQRFSDESLQVSDRNEGVKAAAFINCLRRVVSFLSLPKRDPPR